MQFSSLLLGDLQSPLHLATYLNLTQVVKDLVEKGATLELQDQDGNTALHMACQQGRTECATEMTRQVSSSKLAPVLETQNWRGDIIFDNLLSFIELLLVSLFINFQTESRRKVQSVSS